MARADPLGAVWTLVTALGEGFPVDVGVDQTVAVVVETVADLAGWLDDANAGEPAAITGARSSCTHAQLSGVAAQVEPGIVLVQLAVAVVVYSVAGLVSCGSRVAVPEVVGVADAGVFDRNLRCPHALRGAIARGRHDDQE